MQWWLQHKADATSATPADGGKNLTGIFARFGRKKKPNRAPSPAHTCHSCAVPALSCVGLLRAEVYPAPPPQASAKREP